MTGWTDEEGAGRTAGGVAGLTTGGLPYDEAADGIGGVVPGVEVEPTGLAGRPFTDLIEVVREPPPFVLAALDFGRVGSFGFSSTSLPLPLSLFLALTATPFRWASSFFASFHSCFSSLVFFFFGSTLAATAIAESPSCARFRAFRSALVMLGPAAAISEPFLGNFAGFAGVDKEASSSALRLLSSLDENFLRAFFVSAGLSIADESCCFGCAIWAPKEEGPE